MLSAAYGFGDVDDGHAAAAGSCMSKHSREDRTAVGVLRRVPRVVSIAVSISGIILLVGSVPSPIGWVDWPTSFVGPGAVLIGVGLTTWIAQLGLETVVDKRQGVLDSSTRQNRSRIYEEVFRHVIESFGAPTKTLTEYAARSRAATWASTETLNALTDWFRYASKHTGTDTELSNKLAERYELVYRIARSMRIDLQLDDPQVSKDALIGMIFNDYDAEKHNSSQVQKLTVDLGGNAVIS